MSQEKTVEKPNCKISIDCYGGITVEAPTAAEAKDLLKQALEVKKTQAINEAIR